MCFAREPGLLGAMGELDVSLLDLEVVELRGHPVLRVRPCGLVVRGCSPPAVWKIRASDGVGGVHGVGTTGRCSVLRLPWLPGRALRRRHVRQLATIATPTADNPA